MNRKLSSSDLQLSITEVYKRAQPNAYSTETVYNLVPKCKV